MSSWAISNKINTYWTCEYVEHEDGTATILAHYRDGRRSGVDRQTLKYSHIEEEGRVAHTLVLFQPGEMSWNRGPELKRLKIRNPMNVFRYQYEPELKTMGDQDWR